MSNTDKLVTILGGSGFIGTQVVRALAKKGYRVRVAVRRPHLAGHLRVGGDVGQIELMQANLRHKPSLRRACEGAWAVINLAAILQEKGKQSFKGVHVLGAENAAEAAAEAGAERFIQMSAIGADPKSWSRYAKTKAQGEAAVRRHMPDATILRPSVVFGPEDDLFNRFAKMLMYAPRFAPIPILIGGGKTKFQPIYVGDVADAVAASLEREDARARTYELAGPEVVTFKEMMAKLLKEIDRPRFLAPLPFLLAKPMGLTLGAMRHIPVFNWFYTPPITSDQVTLLMRDNIAGLEQDATIGTIQDLGVTELETLDAVLPRYLWRFRKSGQFHQRAEA